MAYTAVATYFYGVKLRHRCRVEVDDNPADPTTIAVYQIDPFGNQTGPFPPTKESQGVYEFIKVYTATTPSQAQGQWTTFWRGIGAAEGGAVRQHFIATLPIITSI